jgi:hypothetical protein
MSTPWRRAELIVTLEGQGACQEVVVRAVKIERVYAYKIPCYQGNLQGILRKRPFSMLPTVGIALLFQTLRNAVPYSSEQGFFWGKQGILGVRAGIAG